ncbi:MAG: large-conductance mechanosensitive channel protein MscL [Lentisphaerae bacterium]|nr:large-conductance mechanosensitive channel protein MscL [Lentisphaerota bacterium]
MIKEFKEFAVKGNAIDMAVGIVIGGAFGKIVTSLVNDVIMPPFGYIMGGIDFSDKKLTLREAVEGGLPGVTLNWGLFANAVVNFVIVAFAIFMLVKAINKLKRKEAVAPSVPAPTPPDVILLTEIRDLLKRQ